MSCNCNNNCQEDQCLSSLTFVIEDNFLIPRLNGVPLEPINFESIVKASETDTRLQVDITNKRLVYTGEQSANDLSSPDYISIPSIASLISITELLDVDDSLASQGDILSFDPLINKWRAYTIPSGTVVTPVGVDANGNLVKSGSPDPISSPDTVPLGGILIWPASIASLPVAYKRCNGQALSRTVYSDLFALIGTTYGAGDGSTTFNLPNTQTRVVAGQSDSDTQFDVIGETGGSKTHQLTTAELPSHSHSMSSAGSHNHTLSNNVIKTGSSTTGLVPGGFDDATWGTSSTSSNGAHTHTINNTGSNSPHNNLQPYIVMNYVMRVI